MTVKRTKDPAGLLPDSIEVSVDRDGRAEDNLHELQATLEIVNRNTIVSRIKRLKEVGHGELSRHADELLNVAAEKYAAGCTRHGHCNLEEDLELRAAVAEAEHAALYLAAAPAVQTGRKVRAPFEDANQRRTQGAKANQERWQRLADEKWADPQHAGKSAANIADLIANPGENVDTIRRKIRRKLA